MSNIVRLYPATCADCGSYDCTCTARDLAMACLHVAQDAMRMDRPAAYADAADVIDDIHDNHLSRAEFWQLADAMRAKRYRAERRLLSDPRERRNLRDQITAMFRSSIDAGSF